MILAQSKLLFEVKLRMSSRRTSASAIFTQDQLPSLTLDMSFLVTSSPLNPTECASISVRAYLSLHIKISAPTTYSALIHQFYSSPVQHHSHCDMSEVPQMADAPVPFADKDRHADPCHISVLI